jgi:hypothetical protein
VKENLLSLVEKDVTEVMVFTPGVKWSVSLFSFVCVCVSNCIVQQWLGLLVMIKNAYIQSHIESCQDMTLNIPLRVISIFSPPGAFQKCLSRTAGLVSHLTINCQVSTE